MPGRKGARDLNRKWRVFVLAAALTLAASACSGATPDEGPRGERPTSPGTPAESPRIKRVGGVDIAVPPATVPPELQPYPYVTPTPAQEETVLDGTYMKIRTLEQLGGVPDALPIKCLRCAPFQPHPGVTTLILHRGTYYLDHQMANFRTLGHYVVRGRTISFFNDVNCTLERGRYAWERDGERLHLQEVRDECSGKARAVDLTTLPWTRVDPCAFRILKLWPGPLECG